MYVAAMNIRSHKKLYKKGDILGNEFTENDILRFVDMGAVFLRGEASFSEANAFKENIFKESEEVVFLDEDALRKMRSKSELVEYGESIGVDISENLTKEEMINLLLNYIEEEEDNVAGL